MRDTIKLFHPVFIVLVIGLVALMLVGIVAVAFDQKRKTEEAEEMARQQNDLVIADTEWPEGWTGSRRDSIVFAKTQDADIRKEDDKLRNTRWPSGRSFVDREDSLQFALAQDDEDRKEREARALEARERRAREQEARERRASYTWSTTYFVNEWGDRSSNGAESSQLGPETPMGWPYNDIKGQIFVQCRGPMTWIRFTDSPNLTGDETKDGYSVSYLSVRLDGQTTRWRVTQNWGDNDLNLPRSAINAFRRSKTFEIILPWYGEGNVRFKWDLTGSSEMISEACG